MKHLVIFSFSLFSVLSFGMDDPLEPVKYDAWHLIKIMGASTSVKKVVIRTNSGELRGGLITEDEQCFQHFPGESPSPENPLFTECDEEFNIALSPKGTPFDNWVYRFRKERLVAWDGEKACFATTRNQKSMIPCALLRKNFGEPVKLPLNVTRVVAVDPDGQCLAYSNGKPGPCIEAEAIALKEALEETNNPVLRFLCGPKNTTEYNGRTYKRVDYYPKDWTICKWSAIVLPTGLAVGGALTFTPAAPVGWVVMGVSALFTVGLLPSQIL